MDILMIANFCLDFSENDNGRFNYLAKSLSKNHEVEIVTSDFYHGIKKYRGNVPQLPYKVTLVHEPGYRRNICLKRFYSHYIWGKNVLKYLKGRKKPDLVYCAIPSLTAPFLTEKYCVRQRIKYIIDIQDLWPEAFEMVFDVPIISKLAYMPFRWIADKIYFHADVIIAVSQTYLERARKVNPKCKSGHSVFLGTSLETFDENARNNKVQNKDADELWMGYCGTLGSSYDLFSVFDALEIVKRRGIQVPKFIIMGDGPRRSEFEEYATKKGVNCKFTGYLTYDKMCGFLKACDFVVNPINKGSAGSIINKHADYAASGKPVLNTQESIEYRNLVENYQMGLNCNNSDPQDLAEKMIQLIQNKMLC